eukprot:13136277-Ditylum_brightwellii.AAC.1
MCNTKLDDMDVAIPVGEQPTFGQKYPKPNDIKREGLLSHGSMCSPRIPPKQSGQTEPMSTQTKSYHSLQYLLRRR